MINTVTYLRNNQAVSWPGFEPATASHKSNVQTHIRTFPGPELNCRTRAILGKGLERGVKVRKITNMETMGASSPSAPQIATLLTASQYFVAELIQNGFGRSKNAVQSHGHTQGSTISPIFKKTNKMFTF